MVANVSHEPIVQMVGIGKSFGPVRVLDQVALSVHPGEVQILAGENGAGKSTLIKILSGVYTDYDGQILLDGRSVRLRSPLHANQLGIAVIHQELSLVPSMSVADNLFLGAWPTKLGFVAESAQRQAAKAALARLGLELDVRRLVGGLPIAVQQLIEIAKALHHNARVLVMDEPTSALNAPDVERLFELISDLKANGVGIVYITHKMEEIVRIADRITVLRDGRLVTSAPAAEMPPQTLIRHMVGRELDEQFPRHTPELGAVRLRIEDFHLPHANRLQPPLVDHVSLEVRSGEILGLAGLQGSGNSELLMGLFGAYGARTSGHVALDGKTVNVNTPGDAIRNGLALVTNDRKQTGLVLGLSITANATLAALGKLSRFGWRQPGRELQAVQQMASELQLRAASLDMPVAQLSGGNQQKVVLGKWMQTRPRVLLLDEPTRGVDVGAKREVYELINTWTAAGLAILLITSEMPELLSLSDRVVVMHRGQLTACFERGQANADDILAAAMGRTWEAV